MIFSLCHDKKKFVYEVVDFFGNELTLEELHYWHIFHRIQSALFHKIEYLGMSWDKLNDEIDAKDQEQKNERERLERERQKKSRNLR